MKSLIFTISILGFLSFYFLDVYTTGNQPSHLQNTSNAIKKTDYNSNEDIVLKSEDIILSSVTKSFDLNRTTPYQIIAINDIEVVKILKELQSLDKDNNSSNTHHVTQVNEQFTDIEFALLLENSIKTTS